MTSKEGKEPAASSDSAGERSMPESTFEQTDASPRAIAWAALGLLLMIALAGVIVAATRQLFSPSGPNYRSAEASQKHLFEQRKPLKQAAPGVAIQPSIELQKVRKAETQKLSQYEWSDSKQRFAKIPIARALELIAAESPDSDATGGPP